MTADGVLIRWDAEVIKRSVGRRLLWLVVLAVVLSVIVVVSVIFGVWAVSLDDALAALSDRTVTVEQAVTAGRLPRTVLGLLSGMSLAITGGVTQAVTRNLLADPGTLGVLLRASFAVVIGLVFFGLFRPYARLSIAALGAGVAAGFVYGVGSLGRGGTTPLKLALAGTATSAARSSLASAILLPRVWAMDSFRFQQIGGTGGATRDWVGLAAPFLMAGALICLFSARGMNSLVLGDDVAIGLGENVMRARLVASIGAAILCGVTTVVCGSITFVGSIVPHLCRPLAGISHRWMLSFVGLAGACLLFVADTLGRIVTPNSRIDVGIITPFLEAPFFIWIVQRQKAREL